MEIVTPRLILREFTAEDLPALLADYADPRHTEFYGPEDLDPDQASGLIRLFLAWAAASPRQNYQLSIARREAPAESIGNCGVRLEGCEAGLGEFGLQISPGHWGRGFAAEAARAVLGFAFRDLGLREVRGVTVTENTRVQRLVERLGFSKVESRPGPGWMQARGWSETVWALTAEDWRDSLDLRPEQLTALDYLRRKGTEAPAHQLHGHVAKTFQDFEAFLDEVPSTLRATKPSPQAWSAHEVVDHLVESHRPAVEQLRSLVAGSRPKGAPIPASLQSENPFQRSWEDLVAELREIHRSFLGLIEGASDPAGVKTPVVMVIKIDKAPVTWKAELDWKAYAQAFRVHTVEHKTQIERTLAALAAPAPESGLPDVPAWPWSDELDGVRAAPRSHVVLLENEDTRVLHVVLEPGQKEPFHTHRWSSTLIVARPARIRYYGADGAVSSETPLDAPGGPGAEEMGPEGLHAVENIDTHQYEAFRVERKR